MNFKLILKRRNLIESFFSLSILNGLNVLLPLLTLPYVLRIFGVANYGIYAYVNVLIQYLFLLNTYGFNLSATKQVSQFRNDTDKLSTIYNSVIASRIVLLIIGASFFALTAPFFLKTYNEKIIFVFGLGMVLGDTFNPVWLFQGLEKMRYITIINVVSKSIITILIFVFIKKPGDFIYLMLINSLGYILAGILSVIIVKNKFNIKLFPFKWHDMKLQLKEGLPLFGTNVGTNLYGNANIFILKLFLDETAVGFYAAAERIIKGFQSLTSPVTQALFPHIGNEFIDKNEDYKIRKIKRISKSLLLFLIVPNLIIFFSADILVDLFCGQSYGMSSALLKIMSPVITIGTLNYTIGVIGLVNLNLQKYFFYSVIATGLFSVLFLIAGIPQFGIYAASVAVPLSEIFLLMLCLIKLNKFKSNE